MAKGGGSLPGDAIQQRIYSPSNMGGARYNQWWGGAKKSYQAAVWYHGMKVSLILRSQESHSCANKGDRGECSEGHIWAYLSPPQQCSLLNTKIDCVVPLQYQWRECKRAYSERCKNTASRRRDFQSLCQSAHLFTDWCPLWVQPTSFAQG